VEGLRKPILAEGVVTAPSFSHSLKDPVFDDIVVRPHHRIVIIEGLYALLGTDPWVKAANLLDERWFVTVNAELGKHRLCTRHVETGVAADWEEAVWRADNNDIPSGRFAVDFSLILTPFRCRVCGDQYAEAYETHPQRGGPHLAPDRLRNSVPS
jgi:pantothenate kinase